MRALVLLLAVSISACELDFTGIGDGLVEATGLTAGPSDGNGGTTPEPVERVEVTVSGVITLDGSPPDAAHLRIDDGRLFRFVGDTLYHVVDSVPAAKCDSGPSLNVQVWSGAGSTGTNQLIRCGDNVIDLRLHMPELPPGDEPAPAEPNPAPAP